jgi:hypothetical protein
MTSGGNGCCRVVYGAPEKEQQEIMSMCDGTQMVSRVRRRGMGVPWGIEERS